MVIHGTLQFVSETWWRQGVNNILHVRMRDVPPTHKMSDKTARGGGGSRGGQSGRGGSSKGGSAGGASYTASEARRVRAINSMHPLWPKVHGNKALWTNSNHSGCEVHTCSAALRSTITLIFAIFTYATSSNLQIPIATLEPPTAQHMPQMLHASPLKYTLLSRPTSHHSRLYTRSQLALAAYLIVSNNPPTLLASRLPFCSLSMQNMPSAILSTKHQQDRRIEQASFTGAQRLFRATNASKGRGHPP